MTGATSRGAVIGLGGALFVLTPVIVPASAGSVELTGALFFLTAPLLVLFTSLGALLGAPVSALLAEEPDPQAGAGPPAKLKVLLVVAVIVMGAVLAWSSLGALGVIHGGPW